MKTQEAQATDWSLKKSLENDPQLDGLLNPSTVKIDDKCQMSASDLTPCKLEAASFSCQITATNSLSNSEEMATACTASSVMKTFVEKNSQSFMEEKNTENTTACWRDRMLSQKLPNSAVSMEGKSMYVSKIELGPLSPTGSSFPHPSTLQKVEAKESVPQMLMLLPSCPQYSEIPGMAYLQQSQHRAWADDRRSLYQKLCSSGPPSLLYSGHDTLALGGHYGMTKMVTSALSCSGPESQSTLNVESKIPLLVSTCPQNSRIPGLPSVACVNRHEQTVWDKCSLWKKQFQGEETFGSLLKYHTVTDSNMVKIMVALLPTCPRMARVPGCPSVCLAKVLN
ncbi:hypothetical protein fugu_001598 [Takifugu bimaculatus]|uniref:Uncharacterized protein n=1 Tax=Takifugu bimaculatus TaxID=433685 RepID=A0A4Z2BND7_9TELE|nr:hypothetical protein fugu_001598 [Takifugu bimaculatus]